MEKNELNDPLDEYVRRSFDDHEENPAADMWSRIEGDLVPVALPTWRIFFLKNRLRLAAAVIVLLFSGLVCEHYYYENKMKELSGRGAGGEATPGQPVAAPLPPPNLPGNDRPATRDVALLPLGGGAGGVATPGQPVATTPPSPNLPGNDRPATLDVSHLPLGGGVWHIGLSLMPHRTFQSTPATGERPGRPVFVGRPERPEVSTDWWLRFGRQTGKGFGLESGIGSSKNVREMAHTAQFRFADGTPHPGGPFGQRRNFSYDLSTYGGSASVSLRMESSDGTTPVDDTEPVVVKIKTSEQTHLLSVPLLLTYRFGTGRFQAVGKAGLMGYFFLKNDFSITARTSENSRLQFAQSADAFEYQRTGDFFLGYWVSAGLEVRLNNRLSLFAEPAVAGNFARTDEQGRGLPNQVLAGLNVGANWTF